MATKEKKVVALSHLDNDGAIRMEMGRPYRAIVVIKGVAPLIFHRWSPGDQSVKGTTRKGGISSKTDNVESYVFRNDAGQLCLPGEYFRQAIIGASKFRKDPRSPRASAVTLFKAGLVCANELSSLGVEAWDYLDTRRAIIQRSAISRVRPALHAGWEATFELDVILAEYIEPSLLQDAVSDAGRFIGVGDFRPTHGRFQTIRFDIERETA
jgi:hypothetical protein